MTQKCSSGVFTPCTCANGTAAVQGGSNCDGTLCEGFGGNEDCSACDDGYHLSSTASVTLQTCLPNVCTCTDGTGAVGVSRERKWVLNTFGQPEQNQINGVVIEDEYEKQSGFPPGPQPVHGNAGAITCTSHGAAICSECQRGFKIDPNNPGQCIDDPDLWEYKYEVRETFTGDCNSITPADITVFTNALEAQYKRDTGGRQTTGGGGPRTKVINVGHSCGSINFWGTIVSYDPQVLGSIIALANPVAVTISQGVVQPLWSVQLNPPARNTDPKVRSAAGLCQVDHFVDHYTRVTSEGRAIQTYNCTKCPVGRANAAGDDPAERRITSDRCDLCAEDYFVASNECVACTAKITLNAGEGRYSKRHWRGGADTTCLPARYCEADHYMPKVRGECTPCPMLGSRKTYISAGSSELAVSQCSPYFSTVVGRASATPSVTSGKDYCNPGYYVEGGVTPVDGVTQIDDICKPCWGGFGYPAGGRVRNNADGLILVDFGTDGDPFGLRQQIVNGQPTRAQRCMRPDDPRMPQSDLGVRSPVSLLAVEHIDNSDDVTATAGVVLGLFVGTVGFVAVVRHYLRRSQQVAAKQDVKDFIADPSERSFLTVSTSLGNADDNHPREPSAESQIASAYGTF